MYQTPPAQPEPHQSEPLQQPYPPEFYQQQPYQQQPYQPDYQQQFYPPYGTPQPLPTSGLAIASLVLGILWLAWLGSILAVIFGHIALRNIRRGVERGWGLAVAGLVLGYTGVATLVLVVILAVVGSNTTPSPRPQARSEAAPASSPSPVPSPKTAGGAPTGRAPAGYRWLGSAAAGVWFAVPRNWAAVNLAKLNLGQAARHFTLQGLSASQAQSIMAGVSRQHGVFAMDLATVPSSPAFATNANGFCEPSALSSGSALAPVLQAAMRSAARVQYSRIHAQVLGISNATIDGDPGIRTEITLTSTTGLAVSESQYVALTSSGRECYVTLSTGNRAALRHVFNQIGASIHVS